MTLLGLTDDEDKGDDDEEGDEDDNDYISKIIISTVII